MPRESVRDRLESFVANALQHLALEVANPRGQLKILLLLVGLIAAPTIVEFEALVIQGAIG